MLIVGGTLTEGSMGVLLGRVTLGRVGNTPEPAFWPAQSWKRGQQPGELSGAIQQLSVLPQAIIWPLGAAGQQMSRGWMHLSPHGLRGYSQVVSRSWRGLISPARAVGARRRR